MMRTSTVPGVAAVLVPVALRAGIVRTCAGAGRPDGEREERFAGTDPAALRSRFFSGNGDGLPS